LNFLLGQIALWLNKIWSVLKSIAEGDQSASALLLEQVTRIADAAEEPNGDDSLFSIASILRDELGRIADAREALAWYTTGVPDGIVSISVEEVEINGMAVSNVTVVLLPGKPTAVSQKVTVAVAGFVTATIDVPVTGGEDTVKFAVPPDSLIDMTVASVDTRGNVSGATIVPQFAALDMIAPDSPDGIGAVSINDTDVAEPGFAELIPV